MATILVATIEDCRLLTASPREISRASASHSQVIISRGKLHTDLLAAHTGLEPVISALRGQRVNQLHQCAAEDFGIIDAGLNRAQGCIAFADGSRKRLLTRGLLTSSVKQHALQSINCNGATHL